MHFKLAVHSKNNWDMENLGIVIIMLFQTGEELHFVKEYVRESKKCLKQCFSEKDWRRFEFYSSATHNISIISIICHRILTPLPSGSAVELSPTTWEVQVQFLVNHTAVAAAEKKILSRNLEEFQCVTGKGLRGDVDFSGLGRI